MKLCRLTTWTSHTKLLVAGVLCLVLTATAGQAQAAYTEEGNYYPDYLEEYAEAKQITPLSTAYDEDLTTVTQNGITYKLDSTQKTAEVAGYTTDISQTCVIPVTITDNGQTYSVVGIREGGLYNCSTITSLTIPDGIKTIGRNAVAGCTKLQTVSLPKSVTEVGQYAFEDCTSLQAINVANGNSIYYSVDGVLFFKNSYMGTIELFKYPEGRVDRSYTVPDSVSVISHKAFYHSYKLQEVKLSDSVQTIDYTAFQGCKNLESIDFGNGLQTIEGNSFMHCSKLKSLDIPETLSKLETSSFLFCESLESITVAEGNSRFFSDGVGLYEKTEEGTEFCLYAPASKDNSYTVKENTKSIAEDAFWGATNLKSLQLPYGLEKIGSGAFTQVSLTELILPETVTSAEGHICQSCNELKKIDLGGIQEISSAVLYYCSSLESVIIPATVERIEDTPFVGCTSLKNIIVDEGNEQYSSLDGVLFNKDQTDLILYPSAKEDKNYTISKDVTHIGYGAFQYADSLGRIEVEDRNPRYYSKDGVLFENTGEVSKREFFENLGGFFSGDSIDISTSLHTFPLGKDVKTYRIPDDIKAIAPYAFAGCHLNELDLNKVYYVGQRAVSNAEMSQINYGENLTYIGSWAFFSTQNKEIVFPETVQSFGTQAIDYNHQLDHITFKGKRSPQSNSSLAYNCPSLRYVYVPDSEDGSIQADYVRSLAGNLRPGVMIVAGQYVPKEEVASKVASLSENSTKDEINQAAISLVRLTSDDVSQISNDNLKKVDDLFSKTNGIKVIQETQGEQAQQVIVSGAAVASGLTEKIAQGENVADKTVTVKIQEEVPQFGEVCRLNFTMLVEGEEKEPLTPVMVKLPKPDVSEDMLYIVHFMDNGGMELIKHEIVGNKIEFRANAFSSYALLNAAKGRSGVTYSVPDGQQAQLVIACYDASGKMTTCTMTPVRGNGSQAVDVQSGQTFQAFLLRADNQPVGTVTIRDWRLSDEKGDADQ